MFKINVKLFRYIVITLLLIGLIFGIFKIIQNTGNDEILNRIDDEIVNISYNMDDFKQFNYNNENITGRTLFKKNIAIQLYKINNHNISDEIINKWTKPLTKLKKVINVNENLKITHKSENKISSELIIFGELHFKNQDVHYIRIAMSSADYKYLVLEDTYSFLIKNDLFTLNDNGN